MRFATKMTLAVTVLLAVALSAVGTVLVRQNFTDTLNAAIDQNAGQHFMERYALEAVLVDVGTEPTNEVLTRYGTTLNSYMGEGRRMTAIYDEGRGEVYSNFLGFVPAGDRTMLLEEGQVYQLCRYGDVVLMLMASRLDTPRRSVWLVSGYDLSGVFAQRNAQTRNLWRFGGVVLAVGIVLVAVLSHLMTRPIRRLSRAARRIAGGAYEVRTGVAGGDEIGELARSFDAMAAAVERQVEDLNQSVHQRDDFVSAFSHELKTPMTSIIGYSDILRSMQSDENTRHTAANHIYHEAQRLETLSRQLLGLMGLSEQGPALAPVKLASVFAGVWRSLQPLPKGILLEFAPCEGMVVQADKALVVDLVRNLILNAINARPRDGRVRVLLRREEAHCLLTVRDTGCGIPAEELDRITEPFYMVDKSRAREAGGTGVGLALCQRIAALHGSTLQFQSKVGVGTAVSFTLPLWRQDETEAEA